MGNKALESERDTLQLKVKELELPTLLKEEDVVTENAPKTEVLTNEKKDSEELEENIVTENPSKEDAMEEDVVTENSPETDVLTSEKKDSEELEEDMVTENPSKEDAITDE